MEYYEIKDDSWEELIKYYFIEKSKTKKMDFINDILKNENIHKKFTLIKYEKFDEIELLNDFKTFSDKNIPKEKILEMYLLENEWNNKIISIETDNFYIVRIWETSA